MHFITISGPLPNLIQISSLANSATNKALYSSLPETERTEMSHEEDDDAFLYGSDDESVALKKQKLDNGDESATKTANINTDEKTGDGKKEDAAGDEAGDDDDDDDDEEEEDSDSDIEFIVSTEEPKTVASAEEKAKEGTSSGQSASIAGTVSEAIGEVNDLDEAEKITTEAQTTEATITRVPDVDINKVGEYEGEPITSINIQDLKEKPWRQPGADVSEYFNYGFDEFTWVAYCAKQDNLRTNFNPQKVMMSMMPMGLPPMGLPMMMPGMPGMPGMPPPPTGLPAPPQMPSLPQQQQQQQDAPLPYEGEVSNPNLPPPPPTGSTFNSNASLPRAPNGPGGARDYKDREFEQRPERYNNDYRDRDHRRGRGGRRRNQ